MKVFIVTSLPFPHGKASTKRVQCYAKAIISQKVKCEVLLYVRWESSQHSWNNTEGEGTFEGIPFKYMSNNPYREKSVLRHKIGDFYDKYRLLRYLYKELRPGDVVYSFSSGTLSYQLLIRKVVHLKKAFYVSELCELPYITDEGLSAKIKRWLTLHTQFPRYDGIISISETLLQLAKQHSSPKCKHIKIPILVDYNQYDLPDQSEQADSFYIFHAGTLTEQKDGFVGMIEALGKVNLRLNNKVCLLSTGTLNQSPNASKIKELLNKYNIEKNVVFKGFLSEEELKDYLSKASLVVINKYETLQNHYCFSTKLAEYLAASKPIIITNVGEANNWLKNRVNAYVVKSHDNDELANAIVSLYNDSGLRKELSKNGNSLCRKCFHYEVYGKVLEVYFKSFSKDL